MNGIKLVNKFFLKVLKASSFQPNSAEKDGSIIYVRKSTKISGLTQKIFVY